MTRIPKRQSFSILRRFSALFLLVFLLLPLVYIRQAGFGGRLPVLFLSVYILFALAALCLNLNSKKRLRDISIDQDRINVEINTLIDENRKSKALIQSLQLKLKRYSNLREITEKVTLSVSLEETGKIIIDETIKLISSFSSCVLYLINPKTHELNSFLSKSANKAILKAKKGDIFDHWALKKMQPLLIEDVRKDFRFDLQKIGQEQFEGILSLVCVPLVTYQKFIGLLRIDSDKASCFSQEDLRLLTTISDLAAVAIDNNMLYEQTLELAIKDALTGLYLKKYFLERLGEELVRSSGNKAEFSLLMIDIDRFKQLNDKFGHVAGDIVLSSIGKRLDKLTRKTSHIASRFGGEEFMVLLTDTSKKEAVEIAERFKQEIKSSPVNVRREEIVLTVSIGVVTCPKDGFQCEDLLRKADSLLYKAKETGRDKVCYQK